MNRETAFRKEEEQNRARWDESAPVHFQSYDEITMLREGEEILDPLELQEIGCVQGKTLLHLQCHIGTDSLAWARRGAKVTGVDFSPESIACAASLRDELDLDARFVCSNVYDLESVLDEQFDIVYTSRGVLCWLKDLPEWGRLIARFLKPGGVFYIMETHPILNAFEEIDGEIVPAYSYFHQDQPTLWDDEEPDYADPDQIIKNPSYEWIWSMSDILGALLGAGLTIESLTEHNRLFFGLFPSMNKEGERWFRLPESTDGRLPLLFTLLASKAA